MAGTQVGSLFYDLDADDSKLTGKLDDADKKVKNFGESSEDSAKKLSAGLNKAAAGFAIVGAGLGLIDKQATDFTVDLVKTSKTLGREIGTTTEEASRLTAAFSRMGLESDKTRAAFGIFSKQIVASTTNAEANKIATEKLNLSIEATKKSIKDTTAEIAKNGDKSGDLNAKLKDLNNTLRAQQDALKQSADGFSKIGVNTVDATGKQKDFKVILFEVADKFKAMPDGIDKTALSMELFGRQGKDLIKVLNLGSGGIEDLEKKADALGLTLSEDTIVKVSNLIESQKQLKDATDSLKISIGTATAPILTEFNQALVDVMNSLLATDSPLRGITAGVIAFAPWVFMAAAGLFSFAANVVQVTAAFPGATAAVISFGIAAAPVIATIGLLVAGLVAVKLSLDSVAGAWGAVYNAKQAADNLAPAGQMQDLMNKANAARKSGDTAALNRYTNAIKSLSGNAEGTDNWKGGLTWINEKGPELVNLPSGSQIIPNRLSEKMVNNANTTSNKTVFNIGQINNAQDENYVLRRLDRNQQLEGMGLNPV